MNRYIKFVFALAVFSIAFLGMAGDSYAAKPSDYGLKEGDLVSALFSDDPDVYIINEQGYKRLFLNAEIFNFYGHLGGFFNVKLVSEETLDAFPTSGLFRNCEDNDSRVYGVEIEGEDIGKLRWLNASATSTLSEDPAFFNKVFCVNKKEFNWYPKGLSLKFLKDLPKYERKLAKKIEKAVKKEMKERKDDDKYFKQNIKGVGKIVICHNGSETITVGLPALQAHIKHGDEIGKCDGQTPPPPGDTTAPVISIMFATSTTHNSAHIIWTTNENSDSKVWYSTSTPVVATSSTPSVSSATLITSHDTTLTGLSTSTTYYYLIQSSDASGNIGTSTEQSFTTLSAPDTTAPVISGISATSTASTTASITWTTNEPADSTVWYATSTPVSTATASSTNSASLTTSHNISLSGLNASTLYYYFVGSKDSALNTATSTEYSFTTLAP